MAFFYSMVLKLELIGVPHSKGIMLRRPQFKGKKLPRPTNNLKSSQIMTKFEPVLIQEMPDVLLVVGDVNSTI